MAVRRRAGPGEARPSILGVKLRPGGGTPRRLTKCRLGFDRSELQQRCRRHHGELRILRPQSLPT